MQKPNIQMPEELEEVDLPGPEVQNEDDEASDVKSTMSSFRVAS